MTDETNKLSNDEMRLLVFCRENSFTVEQSFVLCVMLSRQNSNPKESIDLFLTVCEEKKFTDFYDCLPLALDVCNKYDRSGRIVKNWRGKDLGESLV
jgi:hypothetical protein